MPRLRAGSLCHIVLPQEIFAYEERVSKIPAMTAALTGAMHSSLHGLGLRL
jgi:hypothetical protein